MHSQPFVQVDEEPVGQPQSKCFPLQLFPKSSPICIPRTWRTIQDGVHLSLVIGVVSLVVLSALEGGQIVSRSFSVTYVLKATVIITTVVMLGPYFGRLLQTYDQAIVVREKAIAKHRAELVSTYEELVNDIDELLQRATQSAATLAESDFDSKRRDFIRFLDRVEEKGQLLIMSDVDATKLVNEFRHFVQQWLGVFAECSVDPVCKPKLVVSDSELEACKTLSEIVRLVRGRLQSSQVRIIGGTVDQDKQMLQGAKTVACNMIQDRLSEGNVGIEMSSCMEHANRYDNDLEAAPVVIEASPVAANEKDRACKWLSMGSSGCGLKRSASTYPVKISCLCSEVTVLSSDHLRLLMALICLFTLAFTVLHEMIQGEKVGGSVMMIVSTGGILYALSTTLAWFEQIDIIQRMEEQITQLKQESDILKGRQETMKSFWNDVQAITDIWVHRTNPRLALYKEVHSSLEGFKRSEDLIRQLEVSNRCISTLEEKMPELTLWRTDSAISKTEKQKFEMNMKRICNTSEDLPDLLENIDNVCNSRDGFPTVSRAIAGMSLGY